MIKECKVVVFLIFLVAGLIILATYRSFEIFSYSNTGKPLNGHISSSKTGNQMSLSCTEVSIMTWNVWFGSRDGWDHPQKRWKQILNITYQKNPDVIGFQECTQPFLDLVNSSSDFSNLYVPVNSKPKYSRYFVMIYIKKELKEDNKESLELQTMLDRRCEILSFRKEDSKFQFSTVHIESYVTSPGIREIQMQTIFNRLMKKERSMQVSFVVGDFNFDDADKEYEFLKRSPFQDTWPVVHGDKEGFSFETKRNRMNEYAMRQGNEELGSFRLDRILFRTPSENGWNPTLCELIGIDSFQTITLGDGTELPLFPSDHFGLFAKFEMK